MNEEMTELLIGKFLDGEITPAEQRLLDAELKNNPQSRKLLEEFQQLHELTEQMLSWELKDKGAAAEEIFHRAAEQIPLPHQHRRFKLAWWQQIAASVAAALLLGLSVYVAWCQSKDGPNEVIPNQIRQDLAQITPAGNPDLVNIIPQAPGIYGEPLRPVRYGQGSDFYFFRGPDGAEWFIERPPQNQVRKAVCNEDIH